MTNQMEPRYYLKNGNYYEVSHPSQGKVRLARLIDLAQNISWDTGEWETVWVWEPVEHKAQILESLSEEEPIPYMDIVTFQRNYDAKG